MRTGFVNDVFHFSGTRRLVTVCLLSLIGFSAIAQEKAAGLPVAAAAAAPEKATLLDSQLFVGMMSIALFLLLVILIFAKVAKNAIWFRVEEERKKSAADKVIKVLIVLLSVGLFPMSVLAQADTTGIVAVAAGTGAAEVKNDYWGMDGATFYGLACIIAFEILVAWKLYGIAMQQLGAEERRLRLAEEKRKVKAVVKRPTLLEKLNQSVALEQEEDIMLDHNYDGIRELDNNLPPWWKYGFYLSIVFAVVYLFHYHVFHTGKLQLAEYEDQLLQAKYEMALYRKKAANLIDENNATVLTDAAAIAAGKATFVTNCAACHGTAGEGGVGPNLTDDNWLHEGDIKDIFKTIKYGYPEKGMKAWQQDLGARQIHEVASYIVTLRGTNPPNAKEPQGEIYKTAVSDTTGATK